MSNKTFQGQLAEALQGKEVLGNSLRKSLKPRILQHISQCQLQAMETKILSALKQYYVVPSRSVARTMREEILLKVQDLQHQNERRYEIAFRSFPRR
ncbi:MAG: hypothetical protein Q8P95_03265, partial [bacterium]|nr:hypothetical protein [bacterium]